MPGAGEICRIAFFVHFIPCILDDRAQSHSDLNYVELLVNKTRKTYRVLVVLTTSPPENHSGL